MIDPKDLAHCTDAIRHGSLSFHAASHLLPRRVRDPALALYAFCRLADDAVDLHQDKADAVARLTERLDKVYRGQPVDAPADRAFAAVVEASEMPRALPEALLEGLAWDAMERRYETLSDLRAYSARVASAVGAMMCMLMGVRDRNALARACDLGVAMQLTNIARDVGEDAAEGRLYLPQYWLHQAGLTPQAFLADPRPGPEIAHLVRRLLSEADRLYVKAEAGVSRLPVDCRMGIFAARFVYAAIGNAVVRNGYDSVTRRAHTSKGTKAAWLAWSALRGAATTVMPTSPRLYGKPLPETAFLVEAAADPAPVARDWSDALYDALAQAKAHERALKQGQAHPASQDILSRASAS